jgi:hypothetical protein
MRSVVDRNVVKRHIPVYRQSIIKIMMMIILVTIIKLMFFF